MNPYSTNCNPEMTFFGGGKISKNGNESSSSLKVVGISGRRLNQIHPNATLINQPIESLPGPLTALGKTRNRRFKANTRERNRMHGLNAALDRLRMCIPIISQSQKLSKIDSIRLAKNYIEVMGSLLRNTSRGGDPLHYLRSDVRFLSLLSKDLSEATKNVIQGFFYHQLPYDHSGKVVPTSSNTQHQNQSTVTYSTSSSILVYEPNGLLKDLIQTDTSVEYHYDPMQL